MKTDTIAVHFESFSPNVSGRGVVVPHWKQTRVFDSFAIYRYKSEFSASRVFILEWVIISDQIQRQRDTLLNIYLITSWSSLLLNLKSH